MEEKKKFDMDKYMDGDIEVICEGCGRPINIEKTIRTRPIAKDSDGFNVIEQFFLCDYCGKHYTITVIDHEQQKLIQKRQQLKKQIRMHEKIKSREKTIQNLHKKEEYLKKEMKKRASELKEKFKNTIADITPSTDM